MNIYFYKLTHDGGAAPHPARTRMSATTHHPEDRKAAFTGLIVGAVALLGLQPSEVLMVAAHKDDLQAAKRCGLRTAFVRRPLERGPDSNADLSSDRSFDFNADDFNDLASRLGT